MLRANAQLTAGSYWLVAASLMQINEHIYVYINTFYLKWYLNPE